MERHIILAAIDWSVIWGAVVAAFTAVIGYLFGNKQKPTS
jgi:uncharacterized membrane protein